MALSVLLSGHMTTHSKIRQAGFTIVEMLVVVAIIGIVAAAALPSFVKRIPNQRLSRATWQVYADLHQAKAQAVSEDISVRVTFNSSTKKYTIWADENGNGAQDSGEVETKSLSDIAGLDVYTYPTSATFVPNGTIKPADAYYYFYIQLYVPNAGYKYVYAFPNGFIDGYQIQEGS